MRPLSAYAEGGDLESLLREAASRVPVAVLTKNAGVVVEWLEGLEAVVQKGLTPLNTSEKRSHLEKGLHLTWAVLAPVDNDQLSDVLPSLTALLKSVCRALTSSASQPVASLWPANLPESLAVSVTSCFQRCLASLPTPTEAQPWLLPVLTRLPTTPSPARDEVLAAANYLRALNLLLLRTAVGVEATAAFPATPPILHKALVAASEGPLATLVERLRLDGKSPKLKHLAAAAQRMREADHPSLREALDEAARTLEEKGASSLATEGGEDTLPVFVDMQADETIPSHPTKRGREEEEEEEEEDLEEEDGENDSD